VRLVAAFEGVWLDTIKDAKSDEALVAAVGKVAQDRAIYRQAGVDALREAAGNPLAFEYSSNRPLDQARTQGSQVIYGYDFNQLGAVTFNGAVSLYSGTIPSGALYGRFRAGQISAQYDRLLSGAGSANANRTQFSLAGYWQYQPNPSVLNIPAGTVV